ncbi:hypothetical protein HDU83_009611 [Entophlyctis luteolus]|nr:hypothetical protein HDU83_009611 [Entophlyctis luteolus]
MPKAPKQSRTGTSHDTDSPYASSTRLPRSRRAISATCARLGVEAEVSRILDLCAARNDDELRSALTIESDETEKDEDGDGDEDIRTYLRQILLYRDTRGRTLLHFASAAGYTLCVRLAIALGVELLAWDAGDGGGERDRAYERFLSARDTNGNAPIHLAVVGCHLGVVAHLVRAGCDLTACDRNGQTPLLLVQARVRMLGGRTCGGVAAAARAGVRVQMHDIVNVLVAYGSRTSADGDALCARFAALGMDIGSGDDLPTPPRRPKSMTGDLAADIHKTADEVELLLRSLQLT